MLTRCKKDEVTSCWNFDCGTHDYGRIGVDKISKSAHRVSYEVFVGPIPTGLLCCHKCDNRRCINPDHLFVGTQSENILDAFRKGRKTAPTNRPFKLTKDQVVAIREEYAIGKTSYRKLSKKYNTRHSNIEAIVKRWTRKTYEQRASNMLGF